jgi:biotin carboxyl carrier protein
MKLIELIVDGDIQLALTEQVGKDLWVSSKGWSYKIKNFGVNRPKSKRKSAEGDGSISAPMPGQILKVLVKNGDEVVEGQALFMVEAMKMEHTLKAPYSGKVSGLKFKSGDSVNSTDVILIIKKDSDKGERKKDA